MQNAWQVRIVLRLDKILLLHERRSQKPWDPDVITGQETIKATGEPWGCFSEAASPGRTIEDVVLGELHHLLGMSTSLMRDSAAVRFCRGAKIVDRMLETVLSCT